MDAIILDQIPFRADTEGLKKTLHIRTGHKMEGDFDCLVDQAQALAKPKAVYKIAFIDGKADDHVVVDGIKFASRVLRVNLELAQRIFPYVITCGMELEKWSQSIDDMLQKFWADSIKEVALRQARTFLLDHLCETYRLGQTSVMSPGSLKDWPIQQQRPLFELLGDVEGAIGVKLTSSLLMIPNKTVSGIRFPTETTFESCQLCPNERCPNRRAVYDPDLFEEKYSH